MAKRVKSDSKLLFPINSWGEADGHVKRIGDLQLEIQQAEAAAKETIDAAKKELAEKVAPIQEARDLHVLSLEKFASEHQGDFGNKRSKKISFGIIGWRRSCSLLTKKDTLELIKEIMPASVVKAIIRIKESLDKDQVDKLLRDEELEKVGARREYKDVFYVEPEIPKAVDYD